MRKANLEVGVGIFVLVGIACLVYLAVHLGEWEMFRRGYRVYAVFDNISGLKKGAAVEVAGVEVGRVEDIEVTPEYQAKLTLVLNRNVILHEDAIASIRTKGIIGDKFVKLSPGFGEQRIPPGGRIRETESAIELEELVSKFIHGKV
jgi:phospholipid/cholesterol/gamma-HCH transport system substrate-binding protein|uniref:Outer membrane lipid asymmetry maintenance protein MlaD n=1 Tax=Desulfobacca acetoxidans TaxID=60893 RepID=A0A7C3SHZ1_9BACT